MIKRGSTIFLRLALVVVGLAVLAFCVFAVPGVSRGVVLEFPVVSNMEYFILFGLWLSTVPFFFALYQAFLLLNYIDRGDAFSNLSIKALRKIKYSAIIFGILYIGFMPTIFHIAQADDAPGLILIFGAIFIGAPIAIAVFVAVLERLLKNAIDIKSENELTV